jgi:hypothetical protein
MGGGGVWMQRRGLLSNRWATKQPLVPIVLYLNTHTHIQPTQPNPTQPNSKPHTSPPRPANPPHPRTDSHGLGAPVHRFAVGEGDLISYLNVWRGWNEGRRDKRWAVAHLVSHRSMLRAADIRAQLEARLRRSRVPIESALEGDGGGGDGPGGLEAVRKTLAAGMFINAAKLTEEVLVKRSGGCGGGGGGGGAVRACMSVCVCSWVHVGYVCVCPCMRSCACACLRLCIVPIPSVGNTAAGPCLGSWGHGLSS